MGALSVPLVYPSDTSKCVRLSSKEEASKRRSAARETKRGSPRGAVLLSSDRRHAGGVGRALPALLPPFLVYSDMLSSRGASSAAIKRLTIEYKQLSSDPTSLFPATGPIDESNYLLWEALVPGPEGTPFEGGVFSARLTFPSTYPLEPPTMKFDPPLFHPNVYPDGTVCISILHAAGDDPNMYESSSERWSPVQSIEKILLSVLSMLAEPNVESGANIDACKMYRDNRKAYEDKIRADVLKSLGLA